MSRGKRNKFTEIFPCEFSLNFVFYPKSEIWRFAGSPATSCWGRHTGSTGQTPYEAQGTTKIKNCGFPPRSERENQSWLNLERLGLFGAMGLTHFRTKRLRRRDPTGNRRRTPPGGRRCRSDEKSIILMGSNEVRVRAAAFDFSRLDLLKTQSTEFRVCKSSRSDRF